jgi:hypothetical protein
VRLKPSFVTRLGWWLEERTDSIRERIDAKFVGGFLLLAALLLLGGFAAHELVSAQASTSTQRLVTLTTTVRRLEGVRPHGTDHTGVFAAQAQTVSQTETIHRSKGTRVVTQPVSRYRVVYRKLVVTRNGQTQTVSQPVTDVRTETRTVLVTDPVTETLVRTRTIPVTTTVVRTTMVVTTIRLPGTTVTVP